MKHSAYTGSIEYVEASIIKVVQSGKVRNVQCRVGEREFSHPTPTTSREIWYKSRITRK